MSVLSYSAYNINLTSLYLNILPRYVVISYVILSVKIFLFTLMMAKACCLFWHRSSESFIMHCLINSLSVYCLDGDAISSALAFPALLMTSWLCVKIVCSFLRSTRILLILSLLNCPWSLDCPRIQEVKVQELPKLLQRDKKHRYPFIFTNEWNQICWKILQSISTSFLFDNDIMDTEL